MALITRAHVDLILPMAHHGIWWSIGGVCPAPFILLLFFMDHTDFTFNCFSFYFVEDGQGIKGCNAQFILLGMSSVVCHTINLGETTVPAIARIWSHGFAHPSAYSFTTSIRISSTSSNTSMARPAWNTLPTIRNGHRGGRPPPTH
ncbi:hypothetical protein ARMGADRAFT_220530 [Armillaria gallica]|uniref:Uncharacterized protein n=1 Tax=Armillaria gallica TaxID=47427 RepID=A0A2H3ES04_ARMGA|nr:hypothetical protein ARMGADRAFT_220530 [Armillaria gallica]